MSSSRAAGGRDLNAHLHAVSAEEMELLRVAPEPAALRPIQCSRARFKQAYRILLRKPPSVGVTLLAGNSNVLREQERAETFHTGE